MALGKTALFYRKNRKSYMKKLAKANKHPVWGEQTKKRRKKRRENAKARREAKKNGKDIAGKHHQHKSKGKNTFVDAYDNLSCSEGPRKVGSKRNKNNFGKSIKQLLS